MHVYFVRHGRTHQNEKNIHQSPNVALSPKGCDAVLNVAEFLRSVNPDLLVSSEYTRALETARIVGSRAGLTPVTNGLFYEVERPSKLFGKSIFSLETFWYMGNSLLRRNDPTWRYCDAENFTDIEKRARKALVYLESLFETHTSVVVVSHTVFLNILISYMCKDRMLDVRDLLGVFWGSERMKNGSVVHTEYIPRVQKGVCAWNIIPEVSR
jgi:broad specificity phosphatase PhoE